MEENTINSNAAEKIKIYFNFHVNQLYMCCAPETTVDCNQDGPQGKTGSFLPILATRTSEQ